MKAWSRHYKFKMLVRLENPGLLSRVVEIISELVTEVRIKVNESGLSITAMYPANVSMVRFMLPRSSFSMFETDNEVLGINLDNLKRILKRINTGSSLVMEKKGNMLNIQIHDRIKRIFNLSLIDVESEEKDIPELEFSSIVELNSVDFVNNSDSELKTDKDFLFQTALAASSFLGSFRGFRLSENDVAMEISNLVFSALR